MSRARTRCTFEADQRAQQSEYFRAHYPEHIGFKNADYRLNGECWLNVAPAFAPVAKALFEADPPIEPHTHANHALSSQICCVNFLLPLADKPRLVERWLEPLLDLNGIRVAPIEERAGRQWFIAFEWFPETDYLNEANRKGERPRGANSTSVDAAVRFSHDGKEHLVLIEWKYSESYGATRSDKEKRGDPTRDRRYANIWKRPHGPIRADVPLQLQDFYLNPWYQLLRQQMLAYHAETDPLSEIDRATVLHISPSGNRALKAVNGAQFAALSGDTIFDVFTGLVAPEFRDRFKAVDIEHAFAPLAGWTEADWLPWLQQRYPTLCPIPSKAA